MRLGVGDRLFVFNQTSGEWLAEVAAAGKRGGVLRCLDQTKERRMPADVWLLFAPIRKERTDFIVEKATELGRRGDPAVCTTAFTQSETGADPTGFRRMRSRRRSSAAEPHVPEVRELATLDRVLADWPEGRRLMFCDEGLAGANAGARRGGAGGPWAL
jgi:16S rRNA (uracil1498-N3)-methyltransferase